MRARIATIFFSVSLLTACQSCDKEYYTDSRIQSRHDIVMSILAPDTSNNFIRENDIEVFVGEVVPTDIHNLFVVDGMQDSILKTLLINTRQFLVAYYEHDPNATVSIRDGASSVRLSYVGQGIYRDVNRQLRIRNGHRYDLEVIKENGATYTATTTILDPIRINDAPSDTVEMNVAPSWPQDTTGFSFDASDRAIYYVQSTKWSNLSFTVDSYSFKNRGLASVIFVRNELDSTPIEYVEIEYEARAIDSAFGLFHQPHGHSGTREFGSWDISLYDIPIKKRSNIQGGDVLGVFGNYTADRMTVVYHANWTNGKLRQ